MALISHVRSIGFSTTTSHGFPKPWCLIASVFGLISTAWLAGPSQARDDVARTPAKPTVRGRVLDENSQPVAGARVRLYRRDSLWDRLNPVVEEVKAGPDGRFQMQTPLTTPPRSESRGLPPYVLLADHPGKAVGWRTIPMNASAFETDLTLGSSVVRIITVIDTGGKPVQGAKVVAQGLGDQSAAEPDFQDSLGLRPDDGPLTAITDADGRAKLSQLPKTNASFVATKSGFAETYAFGERKVIRLTPSASLSGTLTSPGGEPLAGVKMVLHASFMWHFEHAVTDAEGHYKFNDLRARGWNMTAWGPNKEGDGKYKLWIDDDRFVMPTTSLALDPNTDQTLDIKAMKAGVIHVTLLEEGTRKPVVGARIWGWDAESGGSGRFNAFTDAKGRATFHAAPSKINLSLAGPPDGVYIGADRFENNFKTTKEIDFVGGEEELEMEMPQIAGPLITVSGVCTLPDGSPAKEATVNAGAGQFVSSGSRSFIRNRRTDREGRFPLEGVPAGHTLQLYVETLDRKFAVAFSALAPEKDDPAFRINVPLMPTVSVEVVLEDREGNPISSKKFHFFPKVGEENFSIHNRTVLSDDKGRVKFDRIVPGLAYWIEEDVPPHEGAIFVGADGRLPWYAETLILAPQEKK